MNGHSTGLAARELRVFYGSKPAVHGIDVEISPGEAVAVIGANGAGKTSMLRGIMGLASVRARTLDFAGASILGVPTHRVARLGIGYVPEGRELFPELNVEEELKLGGRRAPASVYNARLKEMYALFPRLAERRSQITRTLSGGEQQMLAIARVLMAGPSLLLLDEPSLGLAPVIQDDVYEALKRLRGRGVSMLLVEQNAFRALALCDRAYVLELGRITRHDTCAKLSGDPAIRVAYLGG